MSCRGFDNNECPTDDEAKSAELLRVVLRLSTDKIVEDLYKAEYPSMPVPARAESAGIPAAEPRPDAKVCEEYSAMGDARLPRSHGERTQRSPSMIFCDLGGVMPAKRHQTTTKRTADAPTTAAFRQRFGAFGTATSAGLPRTGCVSASKLSGVET
jgi:hypothetical protein